MEKVWQQQPQRVTVPLGPPRQRERRRGGMSGDGGKRQLGAEWESRHSLLRLFFLSAR